jgi:hypothetical protein
MAPPTVTSRRVVAVLVVVFLGLGTLQALAAVSGESARFLLIRASAVGMLVVLGIVVYVLRGALETAPDGD